MADVTPFTINADQNISVELPSAKKVNVNIALGSDYANKRVNVNVFQDRGDDQDWEDVILDSIGEANVTMKITGGDNYRIEAWIDGLGGYVFDDNSTTDTLDDRWISQMDSFGEDSTTHMWQPISTTLITIDDNLIPKTLSVGSGYNTVTISLVNLTKDDNDKISEDVWVSLESNSGSYGDGNANWDNYPVTYDNNITLKVPDGDYKVLVFPMNHNSGYASDGDTNADETLTEFNTINWNYADKVSISSSQASITVTLKSKDDIGDINGTINCGTADCSGWIDISNDINGKGTFVNNDGTYKLQGLSEGEYHAIYWANNSNLVLEDNVTVVKATVTTLDMSKASVSLFSDISGNINDTNAYAVLIKTDGSTWEAIATAQLDASGNFSFGETVQPSSGNTYLVAAAKRTFNSDGTSSIKFSAKSDMQDVVSGNGVNTDNLDFGTTLSAGITITATTATTTE